VTNTPFHLFCQGEINRLDSYYLIPRVREQFRTDVKIPVTINILSDIPAYSIEAIPFLEMALSIGIGRKKVSSCYRIEPAIQLSCICQSRGANIADGTFKDIAF